MKSTAIILLALSLTQQTFSQTYPPGGGSGDPAPDPPTGPTYTGACCLGNYCWNPVVPLFTDYRIELNGKDFYFTGDRPLHDKININGLCGVPGIGKLNVGTNNQTNSSPGGLYYPTYALHAVKSGDGSGAAILAQAYNLNQTGVSIGVDAQANDGYGINIAVRGAGGKLSGGGASYGAVLSSSYPHNVSGFNVGVLAHGSEGSNSNIGVYTSAYSTAPGPWPLSWTMRGYPTANIAVYALTPPGNSSSGSNPGSTWAGWYEGDVYCSGVRYDVNFNAIISDRKFKKDIEEITNASDIIGRLRPKNYYLNTENQYGLRFSNQKQFGFISQEVEEVLPDLVMNNVRPAIQDSTGKVLSESVEYKALNYMGMIAILTKGLQEQQQRITQLEQRLASQERETHTLRQSGAQLEDDKTAEQIPSIMQNDPNPFTGQTVIRFSIPVTTQSAYLVIYDLSGKQLQKTPITERGTSSKTFDATSLLPGIYLYTLSCDGKVLETKRMIVDSK